MSATSPQPDEAERSARIQMLLSDALLKVEQSQLAVMDTVKRVQDIRFAPITMLLTGFGTAAAVIGATVALVKLLGL